MAEIAAAELEVKHAKKCDDPTKLTQSIQKLIPTLYSYAEKQEYEASQIECDLKDDMFAFRNSDDELVAIAKFIVEESDIKLEFKFLKELKVSYGLRVFDSSSQTTFLDKGLTKFSEGSEVKRYPYNWIQSNEKVVAETELVSPGYKSSDGTYFVKSSVELAEIKMGKKDKYIITDFYKSNETNNKRDVNDIKHSVKAGQKGTVKFVYGKSLKQIQDKRIGKNNSDRISNTVFTQFIQKAWSNCDKPGTACDVLESEYNGVAKALKSGGATKPYLVVRADKPKKTDVAAIKKAGVKPMYYMYFGAVKYQDAVPDSQLLKDSNNYYYRAPQNKPNVGLWYLGDIRDPNFRKYYVSQVVKALDQGYEGIFFDGGFNWTGTDGFVGGSEPGATMSLHSAKLLLINDIKKAVNDNNPNAILGIVNSKYVDIYHGFDYVLQENAGTKWLPLPNIPGVVYESNSSSGIPENPFINQFHTRKIIEYTFSHPTNSFWEESYGELVTTAEVFGCKGGNPLLTSTCQNKLNGDGFYFDNGDWWYSQTDDATEIIENLSKYNDFLIDPQTNEKVTVRSNSQSSFSLLTDPVRLNFNRKTYILNYSNGQIYNNLRSSHKFVEGVEYIIADRSSSGSGWYWGGSKFAARNNDEYFYGNFDITEPVVYDSKSRLTANIKTFSKNQTFKYRISEDQEVEEITLNNVKHNFSQSGNLISVKLATPGTSTIKISYK